MVTTTGLTYPASKVLSEIETSQDLERDDHDGDVITREVREELLLEGDHRWLEGEGNGSLRRGVINGKAKIWLVLSNVPRLSLLPCLFITSS